jgi:hypothetical protein
MAEHGEASFRRSDGGPGRGCPLSYRYGARALSGLAPLQADTLYVAGGLYGNVCALERLLALYDAEPGDKTLLFNGDFHWFDVDAVDFRLVTQNVLAHSATRGNVETELAQPAADAGCGCGYPDWVGDAEVARSNRILERLRAAAGPQPHLVASLGELPMYRVAEVGGVRIGIVHGDAESLAGWGFSQETLATPEGAAAARAAFDLARVRVFASSHTCLPVLQDFGAGRLIANNGAAGMPNFRGTRFGLATRISVSPSPRALYAARAGGLHIEAVAIDYDAAAWRARFLRLWPEGTDAHASYFARIEHGPRYELGQALRSQRQPRAAA